MLPNRIDITDNIILSSVQTDKFKTASMQVSLCFPLTPRNYVLGKVLERVLPRGTEKYPSRMYINRKLDELYGADFSIDCSIYSNVLSLCFAANMLNGRYAIDGTDIIGEVLDLTAELLFRPCLDNGIFPRDAVENATQLLKDELLSKKDDRAAYAGIRNGGLQRRDDPSFPTFDYMVDSIASITPEELTEFHKYILGHAPIRVIYVGSESSDVLKDKVLAALGEHKGQLKTKYFPTKKYSREPVSVTEDIASNQSRLIIGFVPKRELNERELLSLTVMNEVLGGGPWSKLFLNVREKLGLCYSCSSHFSRPGAYLYASAGISAHNKDITVDEIFKQLREIQCGNVTDEEMTAVKSNIQFSMLQLYDSPHALSTFYFNRELTDTVCSVEEHFGRLLNITKEDVIAAASLICEDCQFFLCGTLDGGEEEYSNE